MNLKPCPYRQVDDEGQILCDKIKSGDREVTPTICRACPVAQINCAHLRATLDHHARPPIVVRWGNGKSQVWDDLGCDTIALARAACAEKVAPIHSSRDCVGCALRKPAENQASIVNSQPIANPSTFRTDRRALRASPQVVRRAPASAPIAQPVAAAGGQPPAPSSVEGSAVSAAARSNLVAQKIIQLQEWLAKQHRPALPADEENAASLPRASRPAARVSGEEKRVGWTD